MLDAQIKKKITPQRNKSSVKTHYKKHGTKRGSAHLGIHLRKQRHYISIHHVPSKFPMRYYIK